MFIFNKNRLSYERIEEIIGETMLEKIDISKKMGKKEFKEYMELMQPKLARLQRKCKELSIPVIVVFEGFGASGKGIMIAKLIEPLDPRGFKVYTIQRATDEEKERPFLWRFFRKTPAKGRIAIFDRSWYTKVLRERMEGLTTNHELLYAYDEINDFEKLLVEDGIVLIKFFLHITQEEQRQRFEALIANPSTAWRVTHADWEHNKNYDAYLKINDEMLEKTDYGYAPWTIIEAQDQEYAAAKMYQVVVERLEQICKQEKPDDLKQNREMTAESIQELKPCNGKVINPLQESKQQSGKGKNQTRDSKRQIEKAQTIKKGELTIEIKEDSDRFLNGVLNGIDLSKAIKKEEYKKKLNDLQEKLASLQDEMFLHKIPTVIVFEGWDASGKGGAIKRLTQKLDPRAYEVVPISAPDEIERAHHYLWRFYQHLPAAGHMVIFDRSWYGRVMVERIEGFCSQEEWARSYCEINQFEEQLAHFGSVVIKFWLHIDKDEQKRRFEERQKTPGKEWKITEEDWRNRAKWDEYVKAVDEMIVRTSTTYAPWVVVEANSKLYARIKVLETIVEALEERLKQVRR